MVIMMIIAVACYLLLIMAVCFFSLPIQSNPIQSVDDDASQFSPQSKGYNDNLNTRHLMRWLWGFALLPIIITTLIR